MVPALVDAERLAYYARRMNWRGGEEGRRGNKVASFWRNGYLQTVMLRIVSRVVEVTERVAGEGGADP